MKNILIALFPWIAFLSLEGSNPIPKDRHHQFLNQQALASKSFVAGKISDGDKKWWAFQAVTLPQLPKTDTAWAKNPIDLFIESRLNEAELKPALAAGKRELIRRVYYDLIGLPPTPEQITAFLNDKSSDAYERLVDDLLNSPLYGERWAQHWLDVVRYSESDGYRADGFRKEAYQYRDYIVNSFNQDKPYDQFVHEQIAGDEYDPGNKDALTGTMYLRHWIYEYNQRDVKMQWDIILNDVTETTADAFMGMSVACARCHNHKFDPIMQQDYYRLQSFFQAILPREDQLIADVETRKNYDEKLQHWENVTRDLRHQIHNIEYPVLLEKTSDNNFSKFVDEIKDMMLKHPDDRSPYEQQIAQMALRQVKTESKFLRYVPLDQKLILDQLKEKLDTYQHLKPKPLPSMNFVVSDVGPIAPPTLIPDHKDKTPIQPGFLNILDPNPAVIAKVDSSLHSTGRRLTLAKWLTQKNNPLTARVMANRIWQHHFKQGIVSTPNNFGRLGELPTHPELLDWLAFQFIENGWSMKHLHRLICNSATYRQTAQVLPTPLAMKTDPENTLLWRYPALRLDAEQIRDSVLLINGKLELSTLGGPSVEGDQFRRSLYVKKIRNTPDLLLSRFNTPEGFKSSPTRNITNTPLQSLLLFNSNWPIQQSETMAKQLLSAYPSNPERVAHLFNFVYGRNPTSKETQLSLTFVEQQLDPESEHKELTSFSDLCHILINSNEFMNLY